MTTKQKLHELVDDLPEPEVPAAVRYLEYLQDKGDPFVAWLDSRPEEEEELSPAGLAALEEGLEDLDAGRVHTLEEIKKERGL